MKTPFSSCVYTIQSLQFNIVQDLNCLIVAQNEISGYQQLQTFLCFKMSILRGTKKLLLAAGLAGCGAAAAVIFTGLHKDTESFKAHASALAVPFQDFKFSNFYTSPNSPKWDYNWDRRDPGSITPPLKGDFGDMPESDQNAYKERLQKAKASATRHIILIRHGQYKMDGVTDEFRQLTTLGRDQANRIGERLKELELPYTRIIKSTMTRATETADIIHQHLPNIPMSSCDFIREGSPIVPEPPVTHWKPEPKVRIHLSYKNA